MNARVVIASRARYRDTMEHEAASSKIVNDAWSTHVP